MSRKNPIFKRLKLNKDVTYYFSSRFGSLHRQIGILEEEVLRLKNEVALLDEGEEMFKSELSKLSGKIDMVVGERDFYERMATALSDSCRDYEEILESIARKDQEMT